jgi:mevalonate kinase
MIAVPAKLIITGEHAVLYNGFALTCAIKKHLFVDIVVDDCCSFYENSTFIIHIIESFFHHFGIKKVENLMVKINSEIQQNCGLGSSAALIIAIFTTLMRLFDINVNKDEFLSLVQKVENFQHGKSSGVDLKAIYNGGVCFFRQNSFQKVDTNLLKKVLLIDTGRSAFSTKDVVNFVSNSGSLRDGSDLLLRFSKLAERFYTAFIENDVDLLKDCVYTNHLLLKKIGVVSDKVCMMIEDLKKIGVYAKVCGAGTVGHIDDCCGYVAVFHEIGVDILNDLKEIIAFYGFKFEEVDVCFNSLQNCD